ncbi:MAG: SDR family oxidoreductase, partial [Methanobacteriota archaeon]
GFKVYATMRNLEKQQPLQEAMEKAGVNFEIRQLDVTDNSSVQRCVEEIVNKEGRIDLLVNNAGAGFVKPTELATEEEIQTVTDVNYYGVVRCTRAVLPHMREAKTGHIINITSVGGLVGQPFNEFYCAAKFAVEGYTESLATYVQPKFNIKFTLVEPGGIRTEFANNVLKNLQASGGISHEAYLPILQKYIENAQNRMTGDIYQHPDDVAAVVVQCALQQDPPLRIRTSEWSENFCRLKTGLDPDGKKLQKQVVDTFLS